MTASQLIPKVVVLLDPGRAYERALLQGIWKYARESGPWVFIRPAPYYQHFSGLGSEEPAEIRACEANGMIAHFRPSVAGLANLGLPMVVVPGMEILPGMVNLVNDDRAIGHFAADHLHQLGLKHFAYAGFDGLRWSLGRWEGFRERLMELGFSPHCHLVPFCSTSDATTSAQALTGWLEQLPKSVGLMACNDEFALSISDLCRINGIHIPSEVALIGVDNDEVICELNSPPLSSVAISAQRAGYEAAALLDQLMRGRTAGHVVTALPSGVVRRQSTDLMAVGDARVARALRFIQENSRRAIGVEEVARAASLSRRALAELFREHLGRTVGDEIHRRRVEAITHLLVATSRSVAQIAQDVGYDSEKHIARYFQRQTGLTPREYRRRHGIA